MFSDDDLTNRTERIKTGYNNWSLRKILCGVPQEVTMGW